MCPATLSMLRMVAATPQFKQSVDQLCHHFFSNKGPSGVRNCRKCRTCDPGDLCDGGDEFSVQVRPGESLDDECYVVASPITCRNAQGLQNKICGRKGCAMANNYSQLAGHTLAAALLPDQWYKMQHQAPHSNAAKCCTFRPPLVV